MFTQSLLLSMAVALSWPEAEAARRPAPSECRLTHCLVSLIDDVTVSSEEAGLIVSVEVREGKGVEQGSLLAKVNDSHARLQRDIAAAELQVATQKAKNDVNIRYAQAAEKVAQKEHELNVKANLAVPGSKTLVELQKLELQVKQASLQIEQATNEFIVAGHEKDAHAAKVALAENDIERRQIKCPIVGEVVEVLVRPGEWVQAGDKVMRVVRLDRLRIEGFINKDSFSPSEVSNRTVKVDVKLARGRVETFEGQIVFVSPLVVAGGEYLVRAEVVNRQEGGQWLMRPGLEADMTIFTGAMAAALPKR